MTEPENPRKQERGFPRSLESAKNRGALSTFPPPRLLHFLRIQPRKELSSATIPALRSGSSFDWKRLLGTVGGILRQQPPPDRLPHSGAEDGVRVPDGSRGQVELDQLLVYRLDIERADCS